MALDLADRKEIITTARTHATDTGSPEVQISLLTAKIASLAEHMGSNDKDFHGRRGLVMMVAKRNRLLKYLARTNPSRYQALIARLGLRK
jgi:small subunit ribosomal protein S15